MASKRRAKRDEREWCRGYYCAVAALLREGGCVDTNVRSLFNQGGDPELAASEDIALFREHGLMTPNGQAQPPEARKG
jgi:hypothetical protein